MTDSRTTTAAPDVTDGPDGPGATAPGPGRPEAPRSRTRGFTRRSVLGGAAALGGVAALQSLLPPPASARPTAMYVGRGIGDMTGEPLGAGMNGYADTEQMSVGLHLRQRARAFVFADSSSSPRFLHVTAEIGLVFQSIQQEVLRRLAAEFGDTYHEGNVVITATHTHVAPGGLRPPHGRPVDAGLPPGHVRGQLRRHRRRRAHGHHDSPSTVGVTTEPSTTPVSTAHAARSSATPRKNGRTSRGHRPRSQSLQITRGSWWACSACSPPTPLHDLALPARLLGQQGLRRLALGAGGRRAGLLTGGTPA